MPERKDGPNFESMELIRLNEAVTAVNVEPLMPPDYQFQIMEVVSRCGKFVELPGSKVSTSLEATTFTTGYTVVKGPDIKAYLSWCWKLYVSDFRDLVSQVAGQEVIVDPDPKFGVNINTITRKTQRDGYELHTDINHWTGMLAVTDIYKGDGGELLHVLPDGRRVETRIKAGMLYIFDGRNHPHKVNPLNPHGNAHTRITVPMDYVFEGETVERTEDFNALFGNGNGN